MPDAFKGAGLLLVDIQERLAPAIPDAPAVVARIEAILKAARTARLPILASEQYSRGLGPTVASLRSLLAPGEIVEKIHFSAPREAAFQDALRNLGLRHCFVVGMEAHVCVLQSALGLLGQGVAVTLVADAVASRVALNRRVAVARLARAGAAVTDSAALLTAWKAAAA